MVYIVFPGLVLFGTACLAQALRHSSILWSLATLEAVTYNVGHS